MSALPEPDWYVHHLLAHADELPPAQRWELFWRTRPADLPFAALARTQGWVATTAQLRAQGVLDHDVRRQVRRRQWSQPRYGVVSPVWPGDDARREHALAAAAAVLVRDGHVITGRSAAILHGLPTVSVPEHPELTRQDGTAGRRSHAHVFTAGLPTRDVVDWFGAPASSIARTLVDLGRHDAWDAIMAADAARREGLVTAHEVRDVLDRASGWPGVRPARRVLSIASPKAESPLESVTRWRLHVAGFPPPELQYPIGPYAVDLCWPRFRFVLECDGRVKYPDDAPADRDPLWKEKRREAVIRRHRYGVDRVIWSDVVQYWDDTVLRLADRFPAEIVTTTALR